MRAKGSALLFLCIWFVGVNFLKTIIICIGEIKIVSKNVQQVEKELGSFQLVVI